MLDSAVVMLLLLEPSTVMWRSPGYPGGGRETHSPPAPIKKKKSSYSMPLTFGIVCFEGCYSTVDDRRISLTAGRLMLVTTVYTATMLIL